MSDIDARQAFAIEFVQQAGRLARSMRDRPPAVDAKRAIDFCTEADREVEKLIRAEVAKRFGDNFIGEEFGSEAGDAVWVVDPIDGTASYIHGTPRWCVSIGFMLDGVIEIGTIFAPVGQVEAALASGLSQWQRMRQVVLPQAMRIVLPPLVGQYVLLIKDSSVVSAIGLTDLTRVGWLVVQRVPNGLLVLRP
jgi:3'-phosphoadenosine 5'-phosphosulfate (PAPS) 3'-phosphatase